MSGAPATRKWIGAEASFQDLRAPCPARSAQDWARRQGVRDQRYNCLGHSTTGSFRRIETRRMPSRLLPSDGTPEASAEFSLPMPEPSHRARALIFRGTASAKSLN
jgi:hypothetical protein